MAMPKEKKDEEDKMKLLTMFLPVEIIEWYDILVDEHDIANRSEGFRMAITDYVIKLLEARSEVKEVLKGVKNQ
jgi:metal-responsive CopG/Arc/MetJ family transcriptional regulator